MVFLVPFIENWRRKKVGATYCERLDDLLWWSDCDVGCEPDATHSRAWIVKLELRLMKPTAILINISRGTHSSCMWAGGVM